MNRLLLLMVLGVLFSTPVVAQSAIIFESGNLGPTGLSRDDLLNSEPSINLTVSVYGGVRFQLSQPVLITQVGGHFVDSSNGTLFGAIVALDDENDFPDSNDLSTPDVLGNAELIFPVPSDEVFGDLKLSLEPGWYALVFGSGLFGTSGDGGSPLNNPDIGNPSYVGFQPGAEWFNSTTFPNRRYVVSVRPEIELGLGFPVK